jgi:hypothetical protein
MVVRELASAAALMTAFGFSSGAVPLQCGGSDTPAEMRTEDTAGDALWDLADKFHAEHNDAAERETLEDLVQRYPSSRHSPAAKERLAQMGGGGGSTGAAAGGAADAG